MPAFTVAAAEAGLRLDVVLANRQGLSRSAAQRLIAAGSVTVDDVPQTKHHHVQPGERVEHAAPLATPSSLSPEALDIEIVYEDAWLLVVNKAAGVVVHPAPGHEKGTLVHGLLARGIGGGGTARPGIVHRLDKDTSGLMVVARNDDAYRALTAAMARRQVGRTYAALLHGELPQDAGVIDAPMGRHVRDRKRMSLHTAAPRPAVTHFRVLRRYAGFTLVEVRLETGRTHQIRVHFAALGYPVAGDVQYGRRGRPPGLPRQFLHATRLSLAHPGSGEMLTFTADRPGDLAAFRAALEAAESGGGEADRFPPSASATDGDRP
jgi:23S rRNA pseudouridine1911/1915/1917 synthase